MAERKVVSKYPESADQKVSLGPVYAINPRYVRKIEVVELGDESWIVIYGLASYRTTSELETLTWCNMVVDEFLRANPKIEVERFVH